MLWNVRLSYSCISRTKNSISSRSCLTRFRMASRSMQKHYSSQAFPAQRSFTPWRNLVDRCKILSLTKAIRTWEPCFKDGGEYEKLAADKPSQLVCGDPVGLDSRKTSMADESGLRGSLQLSSVLSLLFQ